MRMTDSLNDVMGGLNVETACFPNGHPAPMNPGFLAGRNRGDDLIPGLEPFDRLVLHQVAPREAKGVQPGSLIAPAPSRLDRQRWSLPRCV